jgi:hypothetical protein
VCVCVCVSCEARVRAHGCVAGQEGCVHTGRVDAPALHHTPPRDGAMHLCSMASACSRHTSARLAARKASEAASPAAAALRAASSIPRSLAWRSPRQRHAMHWCKPHTGARRACTTPPSVKRMHSPCHADMQRTAHTRRDARTHAHLMCSTSILASSSSTAPCCQGSSSYSASRLPSGGVLACSARASPPSSADRQGRCASRASCSLVASCEPSQFSASRQACVDAEKASTWTHRARKRRRRGCGGVW